MELVPIGMLVSGNHFCAATQNVNRAGPAASQQQLQTPRQIYCWIKSQKTNPIR
jgi:hypothetical protein